MCLRLQQPAPAPPERMATSPVSLVDAEFVRGFVARWVEAWNARDADRLLALCTPDVEWEDPAFPAPARGGDAVRQYLAETWQIFPDLSFSVPEPPLLATEGGQAAQVWRLTGTFLGPSPPGFAPTGKRVDQLGVDLYEFRDGLLARYRTLYDVAETARQMGLTPARGSRAERAAAFLQRTSMRLRRRKR